MSNPPHLPAQHPESDRPPTQTLVAAAWSAPDEDNESPLIRFGAVLLARWRLMVWLPVTFGVAAVAIALLLDLRYTATATFVPESPSRGGAIPSQLIGLVSQFGMQFGGEEPPEFYQKVLETRTVRDSILLARFPDPRSGSASDDTASVMDILEISEEDPLPERLEAGRRGFSRHVAIGVDPRTRVVQISVTTPYPVLSAQIANHAVDLLNRFNLETRQSVGQERRRFVEQRLLAARDELAAAEEDTRRFLEQNRLFRDSPELTFQYERLQRTVRLKEELVTTLTRQFEEARIQEVNDTRLITLMDRAVPPILKSGPPRRLIVMGSVFFAFLIATSIALITHFMQAARRQERRDVIELAGRWQDLKQDLRNILRRTPAPRSH